MGWEAGQRYRGKAVRSEFQVRKNDTTGTPYVEGLIEVTMGLNQGQRIRYRGYLNSDANRERTAGELRAMGWTGSAWRDTAGLGTKEVSFMCAVDEAADGSGKTYTRAAFVRPVESLDKTKAMRGEDVDALPPPPAAKVANGAPPPRASARELDDDRDLYFPA